MAQVVFIFWYVVSRQGNQMVISDLSVNYFFNESGPTLHVVITNESLSLMTAFHGELAWHSHTREILFTWIPYLLPKHFCSFILDLDEDLQKKLEEAIDGQPWMFGFADVRIQNAAF